MTIVTLALTSSHFYVLPSFPAKYLSGSSVTDGACTESQTTTFSKVIHTPLPSPKPKFGTDVSVQC